jgi:capsular polysaccharide biosynthesis protein
MEPADLILTMAKGALEAMATISVIVPVGRTQRWVLPTSPSPKPCKALSIPCANSHIILPVPNACFYGES